LELESCTPLRDAVCQGKTIENQNQVKTTVNRWLTMTQCDK